MKPIILIFLLKSVFFCSGHKITRNQAQSQHEESLEPNFADMNFPGEPLNPSEYQIAKNYVEEEGTHGSEVYYKESRHQITRNGLAQARYKWPKYGKYVVIPYVISTKFDQKERLFILKAFDNFHDKTCIRFVPRLDQKDYVYIIYGEGCDSDAGRIGGEQTLSLGDGCGYADIAIHELNHAVGFWHEQNRPDRDNHVSVYLENVIPENRFNFDKMSFSELQTFGQKYDTDSIMHYDKWAFSRDYGNLVVMRPKIPNEKMGLAKKLSKIDIAKINLMYKCSEEKFLTKENPIYLDGLETCSNLHTNCTRFASFKSTCGTSLWMKVNCRKACGLCDELCEDIHEDCNTWTLQGACQEHPEYMGIYCRKSCLKC